MRLEDLPNYCYGEPYDWDIQIDGLWIDPRKLTKSIHTKEEIDLGLKEVMLKLKSLPKPSLTREELLEKLREGKEELRGKSNT